jgi:hypothetical protein
VWILDLLMPSKFQNVPKGSNRSEQRQQTRHVPTQQGRYSPAEAPGHEVSLDDTEFVS